jgi:hypothetical protein
VPLYRVADMLILASLASLADVAYSLVGIVSGYYIHI